MEKKKARARRLAGQALRDGSTVRAEKKRKLEQTTPGVRIFKMGGSKESMTILCGKTRADDWKGES